MFYLTSEGFYLGDMTSLSETTSESDTDSAFVKCVMDHDYAQSSNELKNIKDKDPNTSTDRSLNVPMTGNDSNQEEIEPMGQDNVR